MKSLLKILLAGFAVFMVLAMAQEWTVFSSAWFGPDRTPATPEVDGKPAADTVHLMLTLMGHLYANGGDPRFAERMPASEGVLDEMLADIEYLSRNHRRQEMSLERLEIASVESLDADRIEIHTRELWQVRFLRLENNDEIDLPRRETTYGKYLVANGSHGWRIEGWDVLDPRRAKAVKAG